MLQMLLLLGFIIVGAFGLFCFTNMGEFWKHVIESLKNEEENDTQVHWNRKDPYS